MENKMNLIPKDMSISPKTVKSVKTVNYMSIVLGSALSLCVLAGIIYIVYLNTVKVSSQQQIENLKTQITNLQSSEQKLILVKDRLTKISAIQKDESIADTLDSFIDFSNSISQDSTINIMDTKLSSSKSEVTVSADSSLSINRVLGFLGSGQVYKNVVMNTLGFNPLSGYLASFLFE